ncbi:MAG: hypothetical protein ACI9R3_000059 [Verrucomicrobiales bacterium]|jgi:hypothetical protein
MVTMFIPIWTTGYGGVPAQQKNGLPVRAVRCSGCEEIPSPPELRLLNKSRG